MASAKPAAAVNNVGAVVTPGERMTWTVRWRGMTVGRAELAVASRAVDGLLSVASRFRTRGMAESLHPIRLALTTTVDRRTGRPLRALERLRWGKSARTRRYRLGTAAHTNAHSLASAIGVVRARARAGAGGQFVVLFDRDAYQVEVTAPTPHADGLRVACRAVHTGPGRSETIAIDVILSPPPALAPVRIDIANRDGRVTAELVEHDR
jgi:hypothetical protein